MGQFFSVIVMMFIHLDFCLPESLDFFYLETVSQSSSSRKKVKIAT